jgi:hypothetical protein
MHHHPRPAAKRPVINFVVLTGRPFAQIMRLNFNKALLGGAFHDRFIKIRAEHFREYRYEVEFHNDIIIGYCSS